MFNLCSLISTYLFQNVLLDHCYCVTWSRASHESTGIYMFISFFSLFKNTKTISNVNICLSTSFKAIMQKLLFFYLLQKHSSLNPAQNYKRDIRSDQCQSIQIDHSQVSWLLIAQANSALSWPFLTIDIHVSFNNGSLPFSTNFHEVEIGSVYWNVIKGKTSSCWARPHSDWTRG